MKVLIPVAGVGMGHRPYTYTHPKPLLPVAGKAILSYSIDLFKDLGVEEFVFVIGYLGDKIRDYLIDTHPEIKKTFVLQTERKGLGHAVWTARESILDTDNLFIVLGDSIFDIRLEEFLEEPLSCLGVKRVEDPRQFGVCKFDENFMVSELVEKPKIPMTNMALVGLYKCTNTHLLVESLDQLISNDIKTAGEFQLTDALSHMIRSGESFKAIQINNWYDCGKKDILLETNAVLLRKYDKNIEEVTRHENSILIHPVHIGKDCKITNSVVGPYVTIGDNARIDNAVIKNSVIGSYATIREVVLNRSVIGSDASIQGLSQSLNIGDNTEIDFS